MPVFLSSYLLPVNNGKIYLLEDLYLRGGFRIVANLEARNTLHVSTKKPRMVVITADDGKIWQLQPDNTTWAELRTKTTYFPFFTFDVPVPTDTWIVRHNKDTKYFSYTLFDSTGNQIFPDTVKQTNSNTVEFSFSIPVAGHVTLAFAEQS